MRWKASYYSDDFIIFTPLAETSEYIRYENKLDRVGNFNFRLGFLNGRSIRLRLKEK